MRNREFWVLSTYLTRPLFLAMLGFSLFFFMIGFITVRGRTESRVMYPVMPRPRLAIDSQASLDNIRAAGRQAEVDAIDLSRLWFDQRRQARRDPHQPPLQSPPGEEFYQLLREFPNVRQLNYINFGLPVGIDEVSRLHQLEYLTLGVYLETLDALAPLTNVKQINFELVRPPKNSSVLPTLPRLEMVVFRSVNSVDDALLGTLADCPHLQTVVLDFPKRWPANIPVTEAGFAALSRSGSLQKLYLGGDLPDDHQRLFALAAPAFVGRTLYVPRIERNSQMPFLFTAMPFLILSAAVATQLVGQFRSPASRLVPGFGSAHARVAGALLLVLLVAATLRCMAAGGSFASSLLFAGVLVSMPLGGVIGGARLVVSPSAAARFSGVLLSLYMISWFALAVIPEATNYLLINPPRFVPWLLLGITLSMTALAIWSCRTLVFLAPPIAGNTEPEIFNTAWGMPTIGHKWWASASRGDLRVEALPPPLRRTTLWQRIAHWRAGNPPLRSILISFVLVAMGFGIAIFSELSFGWGAALYSQVPLMAALAVWIITAQIGMTWRQRLRMLGMEWLRPVSSVALRREFALALAVDLTPAMAFNALILAICAQLRANHPHHWLSVPATAALIFAAILPVAVGVAGLLAVIVRRWLAWLLAMLVVFVGPGLFGFSMFLLSLLLRERSSISRGFPVDAFPYYFWVPPLLGCALAYVMWRRWEKFEAGSYA